MGVVYLVFDPSVRIELTYMVYKTIASPTMLRRNVEGYSSLRADYAAILDCTVLICITFPVIVR
jgi:hypothetical protein